MTDAAPDPVPLVATPADPLNGRFVTPGDAAIAQRALLLAALAVGRSAIEGVPDGSIMHATAAALRQLGVRLDVEPAVWTVHGLGTFGLLQPQGALALSDPAAAMLFAGLLAPYGFTSHIEGETGPELAAALRTIGASVTAATGGALLCGPVLPAPFTTRLSAPSEPLKSALLLAGLQIPGITTIIEPVPTPDHTEKLLAAFGTQLATEIDASAASVIRLTGMPELRPAHVRVPGDPSGAAHAIVAALIVPGSDVSIENVLINPTRTGLIDTLLEMGGDIQFVGQREVGGEPVADLRVRSSRMKGVRIAADHAAAMLDDMPALAIAAACAHGETAIEGLEGLRRGPADRLAAVAAGLAANRITVAEGDTTLSVTGDGRPDGGGTVATRGDASVAASFLVLGLGARHKVSVDDTTGLASDLPGFGDAMRALGAHFEPAKGRAR